MGKNSEFSTNKSPKLLYQLQFWCVHFSSFVTVSPSEPTYWGQMTETKTHDSVAAHGNNNLPHLFLAFFVWQIIRYFRRSLGTHLEKECCTDRPHGVLPHILLTSGVIKSLYSRRRIHLWEQDMGIPRGLSALPPGLVLCLISSAAFALFSLIHHPEFCEPLEQINWPWEESCGTLI